MAIFSKIAFVSLATLVCTGNAYIRPSSWKNTYKELFGKEVTEELMAQIKQEINDHVADGGEVYGEDLQVDFDEHENVEEVEEDVPESDNMLEAALGDGGARGRGGGKGGDRKNRGEGKGGKRKKKRGRKPKKPSGEKYEYNVASDDHVAPADAPQGKPIKGKKKKAVTKILTELAGETCMDNCAQYCTFGKVELNAMHEPCRKCSRTECLSEIKELFGGKRREKKEKGEKGRPGKGGKRRKKGDRKRGKKNGDDEESEVEMEQRRYGGYGGGGYGYHG